METKFIISRCRGRRPKQSEDLIGTRELLLRAGQEFLTEKGFSSTGIEEILKRVGVPKGSFYHYFSSKEAFALELIEQYAENVARKLDHHFCNQKLSPLNRLRAFIDDAKGELARYEFSRGCLIGILGQEIGGLPESFRFRLKDTFEDWQSRFSVCLLEAKKTGELSSKADTKQLAAFFWIGWEGAILRAKLERTAIPLEVFAELFFALLPTD